MSKNQVIEPTLDNSESVEKSETGADTLTPKRSNRSTKTNLLATLAETLPVFLALLDKANEQGLPVQKVNIYMEGRQAACIVLPTQRWTQDGKYVTLEPLTEEKGAP